jgi:plastocyanin
VGRGARGARHARVQAQGLLTAPRAAHAARSSPSIVLSHLRSNRTLLPAALLAIGTLAACGGAERQAAADPGGQPAASSGASSASSTPSGEQSPDAGGQIIKVEMLTDEQGNNVFRPADVSAKKGDVLRYTLVSGVHNVHFVADSNRGAAGLPATASDMLQLPGQTYDVKVASAPGRYFYQCDPHALLGMVGHLTVQP